MSKQDVIEVEGTVLEPLPMYCFVWNWPMGNASACFGKIRMNPHLPGDRVTELSPSDLTRGSLTAISKPR